MEFKTIELSNPEWNNYIRSSYTYDFHHTSCLHHIEVKDKEKALLFAVQNGNDFLAFPIIIKPIEDTKYFDASSVYGYGGPIASKPFVELPLGIQLYFKNKFLNYCQQKNIIAIFSRLHPLIDHTLFFDGFGSVINLNKTVAIDLTLPIDEQRKAYRKSNKSEINQLRTKKGYTVKLIEHSDKESIDSFIEMYHETMQRVAAKDFYFFDTQYFNSLLKNPCFNCNLLLAYNNGKMAAGAIFTETKKIMQYHLAGTKEDFIKDTPMKLILDEARLLGIEKGLIFLHLGGGVGGSDDDSLFRFKSGFSKNYFQFSVWNLIVNQAIYEELVANKAILSEDYPNYFPLYRAK